MKHLLLLTVLAVTVMLVVPTTVAFAYTAEATVPEAILELEQAQVATIVPVAESPLTIALSQEVLTVAPFLDARYEVVVDKTVTGLAGVVANTSPPFVDAGNLRASPSMSQGIFADNTMTALATTKQAQEVVSILKTPLVDATGFEVIDKVIDTAYAIRTDDVVEAQIASPATIDYLS